MSTPVAYAMPEVCDELELGYAEELVPVRRRVKQGSARLGVVLADADDRSLGTSVAVVGKSLDADVAAIGDQVQYVPESCGDWHELTAAGELLHGAEFIGANAGKIAAVPVHLTGGGTRDVLGVLHRNSAPATADGDVVIGRYYPRPVTVTIPAPPGA